MGWDQVQLLLAVHQSCHAVVDASLVTVFRAVWLTACLGAQIQAAYLCNTRQLRPRVSIKSEDDFLSSDEEKGTGGCYDPLDEMPRIVPGEQPPYFLVQHLTPFSNMQFPTVAPLFVGYQPGGCNFFKI